MSTRGSSQKSSDATDSEKPSAFSVVPEPDAVPFTPVYEPLPVSEGQIPSPFLVVDEGNELPMQPCRPAKIPDKRKPQSPFQIVETNEGFGPMPGYPFPAAYAMPPSPYGPAAHFHPFAANPPAHAYAPPYMLHQYASHPAAHQHGFAHPAYASPAGYPNGYTNGYPAGYPAAHPYTQSAEPPGSAQRHEPHPGPAPMRQLELRAIFGVAHEMGADELLQRSRSLPGIRTIAAISGNGSCAIESLETLLTQLGFGSDQLHISAGQTPIEFIREGSILLAVQTDDGFSPGVRETLILVAREMARLS